MKKSLEDELAELLTEQDVAKFLKVSIACLQHWRWEGKGPPFVKLGRTKYSAVRYKKSDVEAWVGRLGTHKSTSESLGIKRAKLNRKAKARLARLKKKKGEES